MTELALITLENEMDLILAYKKSIRVADLLGLSKSTQTSFATAVSEVCREVIDKAYEGTASVCVSKEDDRFSICANIRGATEGDFDRRNAGFEYARKLVPVLETDIADNQLKVALKLAIPRAKKIDSRKVSVIKLQLEKEGPISAYEEVKLRNAELQQLNQRSEEALTQAELLNEQKVEFLSVASHELNSPLTILRSFTQISLKMDKGTDEALTRRLKKIDQQSAKLVALINQLLDISKIEQGIINYNKEAVNANAFFSASLENVRELIPAHQMEIELGDDCSLNVDLIRIEQVLNNLVTNAAKYSSPNSKITVTSAVKNNEFILTVTDEGIGMSEETISKIFNKFFRSEKVAKKYSGLGMGLYVASKIIGDHGGSIDVKSEEGKGSVFSFTLPLQQNLLEVANAL
ncbi:sensor histidine kinase [Mucilaginibacter litoreus]|uniref:histidine kinase n=1 Tax=Mucilaginibacter litoreus TaxID=1048221 RepID=A0ABW3AWQ2_9SPHI